MSEAFKIKFTRTVPVNGWLLALQLLRQPRELVPLRLPEARSRAQRARINAVCAPALEGGARPLHARCAL